MKASSASVVAQALRPVQSIHRRQPNELEDAPPLGCKGGAYDLAPRTLFSALPYDSRRQSFLFFFLFSIFYFQFSSLATSPTPSPCSPRKLPSIPLPSAPATTASPPQKSGSPAHRSPESRAAPANGARSTSRSSARSPPPAPARTNVLARRCTPHPPTPGPPSSAPSQSPLHVRQSPCGTRPCRSPDSSVESSCASLSRPSRSTPAGCSGPCQSAPSTGGSPAATPSECFLHARLRKAPRHAPGPLRLPPPPASSQYPARGHDARASRRESFA